MKIRLLFLGLTSLLFFACDETQNDFLPPAQMQEILKEIHFADAATERFEAKIQPRNALREDLYDQILERYGISREDFFLSYRYYVEETFILDSLYGDMIDSFNVDVQRLEDSLSVSKARSMEFERLKKIEDTSKTKAEDIRPVWQKKSKGKEK